MLNERIASLEERNSELRSKAHASSPFNKLDGKQTAAGRLDISNHEMALRAALSETVILKQNLFVVSKKIT